METKNPSTHTHVCARTHMHIHMHADVHTHTHVHTDADVCWLTKLPVTNINPMLTTTRL